MWYPDYQKKKQTQFVHTQYFQASSFMHQMSHYVVP